MTADPHIKPWPLWARMVVLIFGAALSWAGWIGLLAIFS